MSEATRQWSLRKRLDKLERQNTALLFLLGCSLLYQFFARESIGDHRGLTLSTANAQTQESTTERVIRAQAFEVVNDAGKVLARLSNECESPRLRFFEPTGVCRAEFGVEMRRSSDSELESELFLCDKHGNRRVLVTSSSTANAVIIRNSMEKKRLRIGTDDKQSPKIEIFDHNGEKIVWQAP